MAQAQQNDEDVCGQIFISWIKDTHETATRENFLRLQDVLNKKCDDKTFVLRSQRLGVNAAITIARLLDRSPVEKIDLYDNVVRDHGVQALAQVVRDSRALTHLNVGSNDIGPLGAIYLASSLPSSNKLQCLILGSEDSDMHMNKVDCEAAKAIADSVGKCKALKWLDLNNNPVGRDSQEAFLCFAKLLERNVVLETLKLGVTDLHTSSAIALVKALTNNTNLTFLDLHGNDLQPAVGEAIAELIESKRARGKPSALKSLLLNGNPRMMARGIVPICRVMRKDTALHTLDLTGNGIGDEGALALAEALLENQTLTHLDLSDNDISEEGCVALCASLQNNTGVAYLALSQNKLKDEGAVALAQTLEVNSTLEHIQLTSTRLSDRGAVALGVALSQNTTVHCLKVGHNHISDQAGRALAELLDKNWRLLTIDIRGNQVSHATLLRLKRVVKKNKALRDGQTPNQLQHEVIRLHYQQYKLQEANQELKDHQKARMDLQEEADKTERKAMQEKENTAKRSKEIIEKIYMVENFCEDLRAKRKAKDEEDQKNHLSHDQEMKALQEKLKVDTAMRIERQADWEAIEQQYKRLEQERQDKLKALKERIQEARVDRDNWNQKRKEYRQQAQRSQEIIADLEKQLAEVQARRMEAERLKRDEAKAKKKANKARSKALDSALIDNLLGAAA